MIPKVFDEFEVSFSVDGVGSCKGAKRGDTAGSVRGCSRDAVFQAELPCRLNELLFLVRRCRTVRFSPMTRSRGFEGGPEDRVNLIVTVLPVEAKPFIRVTHIDDVRKSLERSPWAETSEPTKQAVKWEKILKPGQYLSDVLGSRRLRRVVDDFEGVPTFLFREMVKQERRKWLRCSTCHRGTVKNYACSIRACYDRRNKNFWLDKANTRNFQISYSICRTNKYKMNLVLVSAVEEEVQGSYLRYIVAFVLSLGLMLLFSVPGFAQALRFQPQGASAAGQGNAFSAQADDPSAIHFNPAGLSQVEGIQIQAGIVLMGGSIEYQSPSGLETGGDFGGSVVFPPPSQGYFSANLGSLGFPRLSNMTVGLGVTTPFGLNTRYPVDGPFNSAVTSATLPLIDIKPTVSYKINHALAIGVSADIYTFANFLGEGQVELQSILPGSGGSSVELNGKGTGAGLTASLLYTPLRNGDGKPVATIGLVYTSQSVVPLHGELLVNGAKIADASANLVLPQIYKGAVAIWPIRDRRNEWKLELDVEYVGWKSFRDLDVTLSTGERIPRPQQWKTVPVIAIGTEYKWLGPTWLPDWSIAIRSGYTRTENPVPEATYSPAIASLPANTISLGAGFLCQGSGRFLGVVPCTGTSALWPDGIGLDVAYQEWIYDPVTVTNNLNPAVNGTYYAHVHLGSVSFRFIY